MAGISGFIYLIVGLFVSGFSYYLNNNKGANLAIFIYAGLVLAIIGVIKVGYKLLKSRGLEPVKVRRVQESPVSAFCHNCGNAIKNVENFCTRCGARAFHHRK